MGEFYRISVIVIDSKSFVGSIAGGIFVNFTVAVVVNSVAGYFGCIGVYGFWIVTFTFACRFAAIRACAVAVSV